MNLRKSLTLFWQFKALPFPMLVITRNYITEQKRKPNQISDESFSAQAELSKILNWDPKSIRSNILRRTVITPLTHQSLGDWAV